MIHILLSLVAILLIVTSVTEVFLLSLKNVRIKQLLEKNGCEDQLFDLWDSCSDRIFNTVLLLNILSGTFVLLYFYIIFKPLTANMIYLSIYTILASSGLLSLCNVIPKFIARHKPQIIPTAMIRFFYYLSYLFFIPDKILSALYIPIGKTFGIRHDQIEPLITEEEIKTIVKMGAQEGTVEESEQKMIHSIFEFGDLMVREVMSPRVDMICISEKETLLNAINLIRETHHSRIPVFKENFDDISGILYAKDILDHLNKENLDKITVKTITHTPMFVPETKLISELLHEFRKTKMHLAIAVDEYGGTSGLITIEDILEEIIGEIQDEYDADEEILYKITDEGDYIVDTKMPIPDFKELFRIESELKDEGDYDTVGGYVFTFLGRIPAINEVFKKDNLEIKILDADEKSVKSLKITVSPKEENSCEKENNHV